MSFSDSNKTNRFKGVGRVFRDIKSYTASQGQNACNAMKANELVISLKQSKDKFPGFKKTRVISGNMRHQSLRDDDEAVLWTNEYEEEHVLTSSSYSQPKQKYISDFSPRQSHLSSRPESWNNLQGTDFSFIRNQSESNYHKNENNLIDKKTMKSRNTRVMGFKIPFLGKVK